MPVARTWAAALIFALLLAAPAGAQTKFYFTDDADTASGLDLSNLFVTLDNQWGLKDKCLSGSNANGACAVDGSCPSSTCSGVIQRKLSTTADTGAQVGTTIVKWQDEANQRYLADIWVSEEVFQAADLTGNTWSGFLCAIEDTTSANAYPMVEMFLVAADDGAILCPSIADAWENTVDEITTATRGSIAIKSGTASNPKIEAGAGTCNVAEPFRVVAYVGANIQAALEPRSATFYANGSAGDITAAGADCTDKRAFITSATTLNLVPTPTPTSGSSPTFTPTQTPTITNTPTLTPTCIFTPAPATPTSPPATPTFGGELFVIVQPATPTPTNTVVSGTPTITPTPTITRTPTRTFTPGPTSTPTFPPGYQCELFSFDTQANASFGSSNGAWANPTNAEAVDSTYAVGGGTNNGDYSDYLVLTNILPATDTMYDGAVIYGITLALGGRAVTATTQYAYSVVAVEDDGTYSSTNIAQSEFFSSTSSDDFMNFGGQWELWGEQWCYDSDSDCATASHINLADPDTGFAVSFQRDGAESSVAVDVALLSICFVNGATPTPTAPAQTSTPTITNTPDAGFTPTPTSTATIAPAAADCCRSEVYTVP